MNRTLKLLILSDVLILSGFGLITPIIAIYYDNLQGANLFLIGLASTIFLVTLASLQLLFSWKFKPKDRLWMLKLGTFLILLVPFGYLLANNIYQIFFVEFMYGVGAAFAYPTWSSLFTSNLEKGKRGFQYSVYSSSIGIGTALTAAIGGWLAEKISFQALFLGASAATLVGLLILFRLNKKILRKT